MSRWLSFLFSWGLRKPSRIFRSMSVVVVLLVGIGVGLLYYFESRAREVLDDALAETDLLDPGWRFEEIESSTDKLPPEKKGSIKLEEVGVLLPQDFPAWQGLKFPGETPDTPSHFLKQLKDEFELKMMDLELNRVLNDQQVKALAVELTTCAKALEGALRLREFSGGRLGLIRGKKLDAPKEYHSEIRQIRRLLSFEHLLRVHEQDWLRAMAVCEATLHVGRCIGEEPDSMIQLVRMAIQGGALGQLERMLAQGEPPAQELAKFQKILERE